MILFPETADFVRETDGIRDLKRGMSEFGLEIEIVNADPEGALTGLNVGDAERQGGGAFFVVQVEKSNGQSIRQPAPETLIEPNDRVVFVVRGNKVAAGALFNRPRAPVRVGRGMI